MTSFKALIIEDELDVAELMHLHLTREGFQASVARDGESALRLLEEQEFRLAVVDWMLPGVTGLEICRRIAGRMSVLMVTARADSTDIVQGLEAGADDYVTKPFEISVFVARVRALMRRLNMMPSASNAAPAEVLRLGSMVVDLGSHQATCDGEPLALTPSEFRLLTVLLKNRGRVLSRKQLIESVHGEGVVVIDRAIDTLVFGLRHKLAPNSDLIQTIRGVGYRIHVGDES